MAKITLHSATAAAALRTIGDVRLRRATIPILHYARLDLQGAAPTLRATDLDCEVILPLPEAETSGKGSWMIDPGVFLAALKGTTTAQIEGHESGLKLTADALTLDRQVIIDPMDYPEMSPIPDPEAVEVTLSEAVLHKALTAVRPSISTEETRYYLNGIFFHRSKSTPAETLALVATDGHRLSLFETREPVGGLPAFILPALATSHLRRQLKAEGNRAITLRVLKPRAADDAATRVSFACAEFTLHAKCIDGTFPDFRRVIPERAQSDIEVTIGRTQVARLFSVARASGDQYSRFVRIDPDRGVMGLTSPSEEGTAEVPVSGRGKAFAVNLAYLDAFTRTHGDIRLYGGTPGDAFLVRSEDPAFLGVLMPMRV